MTTEKITCTACPKCGQPVKTVRLDNGEAAEYCTGCDYRRFSDITRLCSCDICRTATNAPPFACFSCGALIGQNDTCPSCGASHFVVFENDKGQILQGLITDAELERLGGSNLGSEELPF